MKRNAKRAIIEVEVVARMRYYLGKNPEYLFATAIDLTRLVARASKPKTLDLWLAELTHLTPGFYATAPIEPKTRKPRKPNTPK